MGLGVLFIGYLLRILNFVRPEYTDLIAFCMMGYALWRLRPYGAYFRYSFYLTVPMALLGAYRLIDAFFPIGESLAGALGIGLTNYTAVQNYADMLLWFAFHILLCRAVYDLAREVGLLRICRRAAFCIVMCVAYYLIGLTLDGLYFVDFVAHISAYFQIPLFLFRLFWQLYSAIMLYSAYAKISFDGEAT